MVIQSALVGLIYWLAMGRASYFVSFAFRKPVVLGVLLVSYMGMFKLDYYMEQRFS